MGQIKIKGTQTQNVEIEISKYDLLMKTIHVVLGTVGLNTDCFIENGEVYIWDGHYHGSHSKTWIRKATKADNLVMDVVMYLEDVSKLPEKKKSVG